LFQRARLRAATRRYIAERRIAIDVALSALGDELTRRRPRGQTTCRSVALKLDVVSGGAQQIRLEDAKPRASRRPRQPQRAWIPRVLVALLVA
jgi:hypothetical protein